MPEKLRIWGAVLRNIEMSQEPRAFQLPVEEIKKTLKRACLGLSQVGGPEEGCRRQVTCPGPLSPPVPVLCVSAALSGSVSHPPASDTPCT